MVEARPKMIEMLDTFRNDLEDLGASLGVTDPVSGDVILNLPGALRPKMAHTKPHRRSRK